MGLWVGCRHFEKRLLTLFLDIRKSGKFLFTVGIEATVDALWLCVLYIGGHDSVD